MKTAKVAVMVGVDQPFEIREYPLTVPEEGMAQMKLISSGVCGTDIHIHRGKIPVALPATIGLEFVGDVMNISENDSKKSGIQAGDRVIVDIACPCGECLLCHDGDDANCVHMGLTNGGNVEVAPHFYGGYGEYNYSPVSNLIKIPDALDAKMTSIFACAGPTALHAFHLAKKAGEHPEEAKVAVVQGAGPVALFATMYLASLGIPNVIVLVPDAERKPERTMLVKKMGATEVLSINKLGMENIVQHVNELSDGLGADLVFEGSGAPVAVPQGMSLLRNRGLYLIPGQYSNSGGIEIQPQLITFKALHIIGSSQYSVSDVHAYLKFLEKNPQLHELILQTATCYHVEDVNQAFDDMKARKNMKTLLVP